MAKSKEIVEKAEGEIVSYDYGDDMSGVGLDDVKGSDLAIPFINLMQRGSPMVKDGKINAGQFYNSVTGEITDEFVFQPVLRQEVWVEWVPRHMGGGLVALHDPLDELVQGILAENKGSRIPPKDAQGKRIPFTVGVNEIVESHYLYGNILNEEGSEIESFALIPFQSTKIKPYRNFTTAMKLTKGKPPIFAFRAKVTSKEESRTLGDSFNYNIAPLRRTWLGSLINPMEERFLLDAAQDLREMINTGQAKADLASQKHEAPAEVASDIPF